VKDTLVTAIRKVKDIALRNEFEKRLRLQKFLASFKEDHSIRDFSDPMREIKSKPLDYENFV